MYNFEYMGNDIDRVGFTFEEGTGLSIFWDVAYEFKLGEKKQYYKHLESDGSGRNYVREDNMKTIEWTPHREKFFKMMEKGLDNLISKCALFFNSENQKNMLAFIDSGQKLLPNMREATDKAKERGMSE